MKIEDLLKQKKLQKEYFKDYPNDPDPYGMELTLGLNYINNFLEKRNGRRIVVVSLPGRMDGETLKYGDK
tara:strand:- start:683 stop:892 length:210 start_codon:yes stop_codon:yes gene_type:complete